MRMFVAPVTKGLSWKRGSELASFTTNGSSGVWMAWAQKECSRGVSGASSPTRDLNH